MTALARLAHAHHALLAHTLLADTWPNCIRAHPILEWTYGQVWEYLDAGNHAYCELYYKGYTSLGSTTTTIRNPLLRQSDGR